MFRNRALGVATALVWLAGAGCDTTEATPIPDGVADIAIDIFDDTAGPDADVMGPDGDAEADGDVESDGDIEAEVDAAPIWPRPIAIDEGPFTLSAVCAGGVCPAGADESPDPSIWGPYPVGVRTFDFESIGKNGQTRHLVVDVWYPAVEAVRDGPFEALDVPALAPPELDEAFEGIEVEPFPQRVTRDADPRVEDGPFPMVLFSHGAYGIRFQSVFYTIFLASHGYVVPAVDHVDNTLWDLFQVGYSIGAVGVNAFERPLDIVATMDRILARNATQDDAFMGMIDPTRIGLSGHSFGGYTSFRVAFTDPRIKAIVPMTPATWPLAVESFDMTKFTVPTLLMASETDATLETDKDMKPAYTLMPQGDKTWVSIRTGGHFTYSDICLLDLMEVAEKLNLGEAAAILQDGCGVENIPTAEAHPIIRQFAIGFFNEHLRDSPDSRDWTNGEAAAEFDDEIIYDNGYETPDTGIPGWPPAE